MNDGKVDPSGRFWAGSMAIDETRRRRDALPPRPRSVRSRRCSCGLTIPNGLDWSADRGTMYYIDTTTSRVDRFDVRRRDRRDLRPPAGRRDRSEPGLPGRHDPRRGGLPVGRPVRRLGRRTATRRMAASTGGSRSPRPSARASPSAVPTSTSCSSRPVRRASRRGGRPDQPHAGGVFRARPGVRGRPREQVPRINVRPDDPWRSPAPTVSAIRATPAGAGRRRWLEGQTQRPRDRERSRTTGRSALHRRSRSPRASPR